jgi:hypothetical protein
LNPSTVASPRDRRLVPLALAALVLFAATLWLDTRQNGFPFFYHPDERNKVDQLITGVWNFHHPLLMLGTADSVKKFLSLPDKEQALVIMGRWCSAAFAAAGVLCLALLAWRERGWPGFWIAGLLLLTQHQVYELAHYFKEDTSLFFAVALTFLALHIHHRRPAWGSSLFAGVACGLCISAKYLGAVMLVPAAIILGAAQRGGRARASQWLWFAGGFLAAAAAVNFPVFTHFDVFIHSFGHESKLVAEGQPGYTGGQIAIFEYLHIFVADTTPMIWLLVIAELIAVRRSRDVFAWTMAIFPFAFMLLLSCSTKTNDRYFLPVTVTLHYLAGLGAVDLPGLVAPNWSARLRPWRLAALALLVNIFFLAPYITAFAHDDRAEMLAWIRSNVPTGAVIGNEDPVYLPIAVHPERLDVQPLISQHVMESRYVADLGPTPAAVAAKGINYIVVSESDYGVFFRKAANAHLAPSLEQKRQFYETLFKDYQPVWERPRGTGIYLHPGLRIYRLTPA